MRSLSARPAGAISHPGRPTDQRQGTTASRKQESDRHRAAPRILLTVVRVALRADRRVDLELVEPVGVGQARVLGGFNWSSQRLVMEVVGDGWWQASGG